MSRKCIVCESEPSKYKCPTCFNHYCSSACCKIHKESEICRKPETLGSNSKPENKRLPITENTVTPDKLDRLAHNKDLRELLCDPLLQKLIKAVDYSQNPFETIQKASDDPDFLKFVDICLKTIGEHNGGDITLK